MPNTKSEQVDCPLLLAVPASPAARRIARYLREYGFDVDQAADSEQALNDLRARRFKVVLVDARLPGPIDGFSVLQHVQRQAADSEVELIHSTPHLLRSVTRLCSRVASRPQDRKRLHPSLRVVRRSTMGDRSGGQGSGQGSGQGNS
jgi:DNA-binding response OmpR family regulator